MEKYGFVYIWYDRKHKRYYIGSHWGTEDDGYICSSPWMKQGHKHRPTDFKRKIIKKFDSREDMIDEENRYLSMIDDEERGKKYYNLRNTSFGHWATHNDSRKTTKERISINTKKAMARPEVREKVSRGWETNKGRAHSPEEKMKRVSAREGYKHSEETKLKIGEFHKGNKYWSGKKHTPETIEKLSGSNNHFYGKTHDEETRKRMSQNISKAMKGKMPKNIPSGLWWNNGLSNKRQAECPGDGWTKGRKRKEANS
jgi:hypothetical protein